MRPRDRDGPLRELPRRQRQAGLTYVKPGPPARLATARSSRRVHGGAQGVGGELGAARSRGARRRRRSLAPGRRHVQLLPRNASRGRLGIPEADPRPAGGVLQPEDLAGPEGPAARALCRRAPRPVGFPGRPCPALGARARHPRDAAGEAQDLGARGAVRAARCALAAGAGATQRLRRDTPAPATNSVVSPVATPAGTPTSTVGGSAKSSASRAAAAPTTTPVPIVATCLQRLRPGSRLAAGRMPASGRAPTAEPPRYRHRHSQPVR